MVIMLHVTPETSETCLNLLSADGHRVERAGHSSDHRWETIYSEVSSQQHGKEIVAMLRQKDVSIMYSPVICKGELSEGELSSNIQNWSFEGMIQE